MKIAAVWRCYAISLQSHLQNQLIPHYGIAIEANGVWAMPLSSPVAIEPIERAFRILEALNRQRTSGLAELSEATELPKPTTARLLETLIALGYVTRVSRKIGYRITDRVLSLAAGVRYIDRLVHAAVPRMNEFTIRTGWPIYLGTISDAVVIIRYSTAPQSPMSFETAGYDLKFQINESALGLAYLAFCTPDERRTIVAAIRSTNGMPLTKARTTALGRELQAIRKRGFSFTRSTRSIRVNGMAVPIIHREHVLGALTLRYPKRAMTETEVARRFAQSLTEVAAAIAADTMSERPNWPP
jgi:IclR family mhp operon transcriptional activator